MILVLKPMEHNDLMQTGQEHDQNYHLISSTSHETTNLFGASHNDFFNGSKIN
jgi:hypothetical protein